jgi:Ca2+:H+ antiporter
VAAAGHASGWSQATEHKLSLAIAVVLFVTYACLLGFELVTHKQLYVGDPQDDGEDREESHRWSVSKSLFVLVVARSLVALMSEFLVGAVEAAQASLRPTEVFVGVIVIAVIGNAALRHPLAAQPLPLPQLFLRPQLQQLRRRPV